MQILSNLRLLRRCKLATSPAPMYRLSSPSRPVLSFMASAPASWWPSALVEPCPVSSSTRRVFRFSHGYRYMSSNSRIEGDELGKQERRFHATYADDIMISLAEHSAKELIACYGHGHPVDGADDERRARVNVITGDEDACRASLEIDSEHDTTRRVDGTDDKATWAAVLPGYPVLPSSSHRDGSIYRDTHGWKEDYHIADRNETRLEAMMLSDPRGCYIDDGMCLTHTTRHMLQIFSLKLSKVLVNGPVELYGYIAVRDNLDSLLNYVFNSSRDDPVIIEQGSFLNMSGPKRGIELYDTILIEYDMRIKIGEQEQDDLQLIDGVSIVDDINSPNCRPFTCPIHGDCGAIDITAAYLDSSVEATIEVVISEVRDSFRMCLNCFSSGLHEEIRLFDGPIGESHALKRYVVAVVMGTQLDLKFKLGTDLAIPAEHCCSFNTNKHGSAIQEIKTDVALISVKVTWSTLPESEWPPKFLA